jgi:hypothetical protein
MQSQVLAHEPMWDVRFHERIALSAIADRLVERNRRSLRVQNDFEKPAFARLRLDRTHQFGTDTSATCSSEYGDTLCLAGVRLGVQASGTHRDALAVGEEMQAGRIEIVKLFFARNALFFHEYDTADLVAAREFFVVPRCSRDDVDLSFQGFPVSACSVAAARDLALDRVC